jgi:hypothetical protein
MTVLFVTAKFPHPCIECGAETKNVRTLDGKFVHEKCDQSAPVASVIERAADHEVQKGIPDADAESLQEKTVAEQARKTLREAELEDPEAHGYASAAEVPPLVEKAEEPSPIEKLFSARPKEVRRAGLSLVESLVDALDKAYYACGRLALARAGEKDDPAEADRLGRWLENRGALEGLAVRLPTLRGARFASVLEDCLDLGARLVDEEKVVLASSVVIARGAGWARKELARRIREELKPKSDTIEEKLAFLDEEKIYRFSLSRIWDRSAPPMILFGLNPSTADEEKDDQTIRRGRTLAKREGKGSLVMLNLFAFRSTDPKGLETVQDPVGEPINDETILEYLGPGPKLVVCAWGALANEKHRARAVEVVELIRDSGIEPMCFGRTKDGAPRHPSRLPNDVALEEYRGEDLGVRWFRCAACQDVGCEKCL